jgi:hypothetical protein
MNVTSLKGGTAPASPAAPRPKILQGLTARRLVKPPRVLVYGQAGVGKSTFAAGAPKPIFVGAEDGTSELEVYRYPGKLDSGDDLFEAIDVLEREEHDFKTVVLDTVDWAEPLIWESVCKEAGKAGKGIESLGYGKGYTRAAEWCVRFLKRLEVLRAAKGMAIVLLGHSSIRTFKNPSGDDYDHYTLKMHEKAAGVLREWCDDVLFAAQETFAVAKDGGRAKGVTSGARVLHTQNMASFFAKTRHALPERLPLDWGEFAAACASARPEDPAVVRARIEAALVEYLAFGSEDGAEFAAKVRNAVADAGDDSAKLVAFANRVSVRLQEKREKAT